jgi:hypothetical protein
MRIDSASSGNTTGDCVYVIASIIFFVAVAMAAPLATNTYYPEFYALFVFWVIYQVVS